MMFEPGQMTSNPSTAPDPGRGDLEKFLESIRRLSEIVRAETEALRGYQLAQINNFTRQKSQALLEFTRLEQHLNLQSPPPDVQTSMKELRALLVENFAVLKLHLRAAQEISDTLTSVALDIDSDGTYTSSNSQAGGSRWQS